MAKDSVVDHMLLREFETFKSLSDMAIDELIPHCQVERISEGTVLFREGGNDNSTVFLIEGAVNLQSMLGDEGILIGGSPQTSDAISDSRPRIVTATAKTEGKILRVNSNVLGMVLNKDQLPSYDVAEVEVSTMSDASNRLFFAVLKDLSSDNLQLPMLPDIAVKVREAVASDDAGPADVAKIIQADPSIAAKVISVANSARFGGMAQVDNVQKGVMRLGLANTRELVMSLTMRNIFSSTDANLKKRLFETWYHSCETAAIATVLARETKGFSADRALLAALVNKIGVVPILKEAENHSEFLFDPTHLEDTIAQLHAQIGNTLLAQWNFPDDIAAAPLESENWHRDPSEKPDYADLLIVSAIQSVVGTSRQDDLPRLGEIPAGKKFDLGEITEGYGSSLLHEKAAEIELELQNLTS